MLHLNQYLDYLKVLCIFIIIFNAFLGLCLFNKFKKKTMQNNIKKQSNNTSFFLCIELQKECLSDMYIKYLTPLEYLINGDKLIEFDKFFKKQKLPNHLFN